jgi:two-component system OmpR family response regulator
MDTTRTHILVVDDVADTADTTVELLTIWGYDAVACYDGATALASARLRPPGAVILDLLMPRMEGFRFAELVRELPRCGSVPLIAVSGYSSAATSARAREAGILHYLLKPVAPAVLQDLVAREIHSRMNLQTADRSDQPGARLPFHVRVSNQAPIRVRAREPGAVLSS